MDKGVGFNRNIKRVWLDATAAFCAESNEATAVRSRLEPIIGLELGSPTNIRKTTDILLNIWYKSRDISPGLVDEAMQMFQDTAVPSDRLWLHYGLTLLTYPFFYTVTGLIGQMGRYEEAFTAVQLKKQTMAELGQLGSLDAAVSRIIFSLRDWGILADGGGRHQYIPQVKQLATERTRLETWLLACVLTANTAESLPLVDLVRLPQLFPFHLTVGAGELRLRADLEIQRQGSSLDMVRFVR